jgi:hypothetical protein
LHRAPALVKGEGAQAREFPVIL